MPKSRTRQKKTNRPYVPAPPKRKPRKSPPWYGYVVVGFIAVGVGVIVWNYMRGDSADNLFLWVGLGLIAAGFAAATQWR